jgi:hypothetical protein
MSYFLLIHFLIMCMSVCPLKHEQPAERFPWRGLLAYQAMVFRRPVGFFLTIHYGRCLVSVSSAYLRQSIFLSPFEGPEFRALFNTALKNTAGKVRVEKIWPAIQVPESIDQVSAFLIVP